MGRQHVLRAPDVNANNARRLNSKDSVFATGLNEPDPAAGFADHGGAKLPLGSPKAFDQTTGPKRFMGHNEYIVYEESRHRIKYVLQCHIRG